LRGPALTAHGSLDLKQEIQIQIQTTDAKQYDLVDKDKRQTLNHFLLFLFFPFSFFCFGCEVGGWVVVVIKKGYGESWVVISINLMCCFNFSLISSISEQFEIRFSGSMKVLPELPSLYI
jgi:hypothetical protein